MHILYFLSSKTIWGLIRLFSRKSHWGIGLLKAQPTDRARIKLLPGKRTDASAKLILFG